MEVMGFLLSRFQWVWTYPLVTEDLIWCSSFQKDYSRNWHDECLQHPDTDQDFYNDLYRAAIDQILGSSTAQNGFCNVVLHHLSPIKLQPGLFLLLTYIPTTYSG